MAIVSGVSIRGTQRVIGYRALTRNYFVTAMPALLTQNPARIGQFWIVVRPNASVNTGTILNTNGLYSPQQIMDFSTVFGFTGVQYAMIVRWNLGGIAFDIEFA